MSVWRWLLLLPCAAAATPGPPAPLLVAGNLDLATFPNSLRPHVATAARTFAAYGFSDVLPSRVDPDAAEVLNPTHSWVFKVTVRGGDADTVRLCVLDEALNGSTYLTQFPMTVRRGPDGLFRAVASEDDAGCSRVLR